MLKALRVGCSRYYDDKIFEEHLAFVKRNLHVLDEITVFADFSHYGYWSPEYTAENVALLRKRFRQYKEIGVKRMGVNILCTIGHLEEGYDVFPHADLQYQVNQYGVESKSCLCPSNEEYLKYIADRYAAYATLDIDYIWMDDDIRTKNHGVARDFCYCPKCMAKFNRENGSDYTAAQLWERLESGDQQVVQAWDAFKDRVMFTLLGTIRRAIKAVNTNMEIGYMSNLDNARAHWIEESQSTMCRPGGGFYTDARPIEVFEKMIDTQMQVQRYPVGMDNIQYEYEAFNYQTLERSVRLSELETSLCLMNGCTGVLYNCDTFNDRQETMTMLEHSMDKWKVLADVTKNCRNAGVYVMDRAVALSLMEISIPITAWLENAVACVVLGDSLRTLSDAKIEEILQKHLLTDGAGVQVLTERGFGDRLGAKIKQIYHTSMAEDLGTHPFNGGYQHYFRDVVMNFGFEADAYEFELGPQAEAVSNLINIKHEFVGTSMYAYEHKDGNRVVADGYLMPKKIKTGAKREQLGNALDWLSGGKMPVRILDEKKVIPVVNSSDDGCMNIMLTNVHFDATGELSCLVRSTKAFTAIGPKGEKLPVKQQIMDGESTITIDNMNGWDYILLTNN